MTTAHTLPAPRPRSEGSLSTRDPLQLYLREIGKFPMLKPEEEQELARRVRDANDQKAGIRENLGDTIWYAAMIANFFDWDLEEILEENRAKLEKRYPKGFTQKNASRKNQRVDWMEK